MVFNYIWIGFFLIAYLVALIKLIFEGDTSIFQAVIDMTFDMSKTGFEIALGLTGIMAFWLGIMSVGEKAGVIRIFSRFIAPFFNRLFPEIPKDHPVFGSILMNISANMLGLDNAATPLGLKAMRELQDINPDKETASNAQIMFLVMNTSGLMLIPVTIMMYRAELGSLYPADVFIPILLSTFFSTIAGIIGVAVWQRINLFDRVIFAYLGGLTLLVAGIIWFFSHMDTETIRTVSLLVANIVLFTIIAFFIGMGLIRKINVYDTFIEGAKEGFKVAVTIIPYLVAVLVAVGAFRASGAMDMFISGLSSAFSYFHINTDFIPALPTALMKPLSGSGARGLMLEAMNHYGPDSFTGKLACTFQGATDTTFYIIALYFGSVGIKNSRYAVSAGLIADLSGIIAAIFIAYMFFV